MNFKKNYYHIKETVTTTQMNLVSTWQISRTIAQPNVATFSRYFLKTTDNTKKQSIKCFLQHYRTFKNCFLYCSFPGMLKKFLVNSAASSMNSEGRHVLTL